MCRLIYRDDNRRGRGLRAEDQLVLASFRFSWARPVSKRDERRKAVRPEGAGQDRQPRSKRSRTGEQAEAIDPRLRPFVEALADLLAADLLGTYTGER